MKLNYYLSLLIPFIIGCVHKQSSVEKEFMPMRDGVRLATDIFLPDDQAPPYPVILIRTPYGKSLLKEYGEYYSSKGYATAIQDVRGKYDSEGDWLPYEFEGTDGYDAIEWLAKKEWSTGKVGMVGGSYSGSVQLAAAIEKPPSLVTIIPNITPATPFNNTPYENGVFALGWGVRWSDIVKDNISGQEMNKKFREVFEKDWNHELDHLPVIDLDMKRAGEEIDFWRTWINHPPEDAYYNAQDYLSQIERIDIPVFLQSGWFDVATRGSKLLFNSLNEAGNKNVKLVIGPWVHSDRSSTQLGGQYLGEAAGLRLFELYTRWFDHWLKGEENGIMNEPLVQLFNMGPNNWLYSNTYPLENTRTHRLFFNSSCKNDSNMVKKLTFEKPETALCSSSFTYDPADPAPAFPDYLKKNELIKYKEETDSRSDVLIFETDVFESPLILSGPISAALYASSSARDTDFSIVLNGVGPDGNIFPIGQTFGIIRAKYRNSFAKPEYLEEGKVYSFRIDLAHAGYTLLPGMRIRVEVSSSLYPEFSRNLNTGLNNQTTTEIRNAEQTIYHNSEYSSYIELTIINN